MMIIVIGYYNSAVITTLFFSSHSWVCHQFLNMWNEITRLILCKRALGCGAFLTFFFPFCFYKDPHSRWAGANEHTVQLAVFYMLIKMWVVNSFPTACQAQRSERGLFALPLRLSRFCMYCVVRCRSAGHYMKNVDNSNSQIPKYLTGF